MASFDQKTVLRVRKDRDLSKTQGEEGEEGIVQAFSGPAGVGRKAIIKSQLMLPSLRPFVAQS